MSSQLSHLGYCTNVHAGADLERTRANLEKHALAVKQQFSPDKSMGVGLWLSSPAARKLIEAKQVDDFGGWLAAVGLVPFTLNGFPYGDFHQPVVKHRVYQPTWCAEERLRYTLDLIQILDGILPPGMAGSISTLPIAWPAPALSADDFDRAAANLRSVATTLRQLEETTGRLIFVCIEPEPGCVLQYTEDVVRFFEDHLLKSDDEPSVRRYLRVCHDVCHADVMFESQHDAIRRYRSAGIEIGKVQISSAVHMPLDQLDEAQRQTAVTQLTQFAEDRYLHQTMVRHAGRQRFFEDLPLALKTHPPSGEWRVHFHVPIYLESFGELKTSRAEILECLDATREFSDVRHFEVETYAWGVLPPGLRHEQLASGIAQELRWFAEHASTPL